jgi:hypothetical protein
MKLEIVRELRGRGTPAVESHYQAQLVQTAID